MVEPLHEYELQVTAAYRALNSEKPTDRGVVVWFHRQLLDHTDLKPMTAKSVARWLTGRYPMPKKAVAMIRKLKREVKRQATRKVQVAQRELDRLKETIG